MPKLSPEYHDEWLTMRDGVRWPTEQCGYAWADTWEKARQEMDEDQTITDREFAALYIVLSELPPDTVSEALQAAADHNNLPLDMLTASYVRFVTKLRAAIHVVKRVGI